MRPDTTLANRYHNHDGHLPTTESGAWRRLAAFGVGLGLLAFAGWLYTSGFIALT